MSTIFLKHHWCSFWFALSFPSTLSRMFVTSPNAMVPILFANTSWESCWLSYVECPLFDVLSVLTFLFRLHEFSVSFRPFLHRLNICWNFASSLLRYLIRRSVSRVIRNNFSASKQVMGRSIPRSTAMIFPFCGFRANSSLYHKVKIILAFFITNLACLIFVSASSVFVSQLVLDCFPSKVWVPSGRSFIAVSSRWKAWTFSFYMAI